MAGGNKCLMQSSGEPGKQPSSSSAGHPTPAYPSAQQRPDHHGPTTAASTPSGAVSTAEDQPFADRKHRLLKRVSEWNDKFEDMCILGRRMQNELEGLMPAAYGRVEEAAIALVERIDQCDLARTAPEQARLARERSSASAELHVRLHDLIELRDHLEVVAMASWVFPIGTPRQPSLDVTAREGLVRLFEGYGVRLPAILKEAHALEQTGA